MGGGAPGGAGGGGGGGNFFFFYRGSLIRFQKIFGDKLLSLRGALQLTQDALPPSEQFRLGGAQTIRGYQEGEYLGDYGMQSSVDLYWPLPLVPENWRFPFSDKKLKEQVQLVGFFDIGTAGLKKPLTGERKHKDLAGYGAGFRVLLYDKVYARCEWGFPVGDRPFDHRGSSFYFSVSYDLF